MLKWLLVLMLAVTQFLSGNCRSTYVCISSDGTFCCLDAGPDSCTCCHSHDEPPAQSSQTLCAIKGSCCPHHHDHEDRDHEDRDHEPPTAQLEGEPQWVEARGCTHIPVLIGQALTTVQIRDSLVWHEQEQFVSDLPSPLVMLDSSEFSLRIGLGHALPGAPNFTLIVVSTTVLRC